MIKSLISVLKTNFRHVRQTGNMAVIELKKTYSSSTLGLLWAIIKPALFVLVYWFGIQVGIRGGTAGDLGEQIAAGKFLVIRVDLSHEGPPCTFGFRKRRRNRDRRSFHTGPFCSGFPRDFRNVT